MLKRIKRPQTESAPGTEHGWLLLPVRAPPSVSHPMLYFSKPDRYLRLLLYLKCVLLRFCTFNFMSGDRKWSVLKELWRLQNLLEFLKTLWTPRLYWAPRRSSCYTPGETTDDFDGHHYLQFSFQPNKPFPPRSWSPYFQISSIFCRIILKFWYK